MQRRVLVTLLGMVIASLTSACGQKSPLFLPEASANNASIKVTCDARNNRNSQKLVLAYTLNSTIGMTTAATATCRCTRVANQAHRLASNL
jgi:predicted small lipoprotein YifL